MDMYLRYTVLFMSRYLINLNLNEHTHLQLFHSYLFNVHVSVRALLFLTSWSHLTCALILFLGRNYRVHCTLYIIWIKLDRGYNDFGLDILFYHDGFPNNLSLHRYYYFILCGKNRSYSLTLKEILKVNWIFWGISILKRTPD